MSQPGKQKHFTKEERRQQVLEVTEAASFVVEQLDAIGAAPHTAMLAMLAGARVKYAAVKKLAPNLPPIEEILKGIAAEEEDLKIQ